MHASAILLVTSACVLFLAAALATIIRGRKLTIISILAICGAGLLMVTASVIGWGKDITITAQSPLYLGVAPATLRFDSLSSVFVLLLGTISFCSALHAGGYLRHLEKRISEPFFWFGVNTFIAAMLLVILSANAPTFLLFWEVMSLSSALLVAAEFASHKAQLAALIYLGATRIASALLAGGFLWCHFLSGTWTFSDWHLTLPSFLVPSLLIAAAFCLKAGIWPFHIWLPYAHPSAPGPVSALMSGVMIKVPLYAIARLFLLDGSGSLTLSAVFLFLGTISALWGVLFALVQNDLKKLLAYSSVENVGLILMGAGLCLYGQATNNPTLAVIGFVAAVFHCINHGVFKALLFLGAGTIDSAVHSRDLSHLGGLAHKMPAAMLCFLIGSISICALPPLNGFASKWLVYQGLFALACDPTQRIIPALALAAIATLAMVGGLTLSCFTKAFSISFLGRPRTNAAEHASEGTTAMKWAQIILAVTCVVLGLCCNQISTLIGKIGGSLLPVSAPTPPLAFTAVAILGLTAIIHSVLYLSTRRCSRKYVTWECGYGKLSSRMQLTAESFASSLATTFRPVLQYATHSEIAGKDRRHFPERIKTETIMVSLLESRLYAPLISFIRRISRHFSRLQAGSIHLYLLYVFLTLVFLLFAGARI